MDLILTVLEYKTEGVQGLQRKGFCSNYLADAHIGSNVLLHLRSSNFHLPTVPTLKQPIMLIGAGAGMAPFRGFWQQLMIDSILADERKVQFVQELEQLDFTDSTTHKKAHQIVETFSDATRRKIISLFFGCRNKQCNLIEGETAAYSHVVHRFNAFSREENQPKQYVSDAMHSQHQLIYQSLVEENGLIYVCGKIAMANSVFKTLVSIVADQLVEQNVIEDTQAANITAEDFVNSLIDDGRYLQDIFGTDDI